MYYLLALDENGWTEERVSEDGKVNPGWTWYDECPYYGFIVWGDKGEYIELKQIYVKERHRGQGVGTKLMKHLETKGSPISTRATVDSSNPFYHLLKSRGYTDDKGTWTKK